MQVLRGDQQRVLVLEQLLNQQRHAELEEFVSQEFSNDLLGDPLLNAARALHSAKVVIFLSTLGVANLAHPGDRAMWLLCYQSIAQKYEVNGFQTLPDDLPVKWVVRQLIGTPTQALAACQGAPVDWVEALELAIDHTRLDLLEALVRHLTTRGLETATWLAIAKTLIDREKLLRHQPDLGFYARSMECIFHQLPDDAETANIRSTLASHAARSFLDVNEPLPAKSMAMAVQAHDTIYEHEHTVCMAEACCRAGELAESIAWMDKALQIAMRPEILDEYRKKIEKRKAQQNTKPSFDPVLAGQALTALQTALDQCGHKIFLVSGTLLGYAREGQLLGHDKDIDVGIMGWINQFDVINAIIQSKEFYVDTASFGKENAYIVPIQHIDTQTAIDVFIYRHEDEKLMTGVNSRFGYLQKFAFTPFDIQPIDFLGITLHAPSNIDLNMEENFGEGWKISDPDYISHLESPSTVDPGGLVYQLVGRLNIYGAISRGKTSKLIRILRLMESQMHMPSGISPELLARLWGLSTRLYDALSPDNETAYAA